MARIAHFSLSVALVCCTAAGAAADPIVVTSGFLIAPRSQAGIVSIQGSRGFTLEGRLDPGEGRVDPLSCSPCIPGVPMSIAANLSGAVFTGPATLDGTAFSDISSVTSPASIAIEIFGGALIPEFRNRPITFRTPFTAEGFFNLPFPAGSESLRGSGFATVRLTPNPFITGDPRNWSVESVRYDFTNPAAVPEPATIVLVGGGLVALARRRSRSRAR